MQKSLQSVICIVKRLCRQVCYCLLFHAKSSGAESFGHGILHAFTIAEQHLSDPVIIGIVAGSGLVVTRYFLVTGKNTRLHIPVSIPVPEGDKSSGCLASNQALHRERPLQGRMPDRLFQEGQIVLISTPLNLKQLICSGYGLQTAKKHVFFFHEFENGVGSAFAPHTAVFHSAKWRIG